MVPFLSCDIEIRQNEQFSHLKLPLHHHQKDISSYIIYHNCLETIIMLIKLNQGVSMTLGFDDGVTEPGVRHLTMVGSHSESNI